MTPADEAHRSGGESYQRIINYFKPQFFLGMTATPERMDGYDIFQLFDYTIAYEIRLHRALEEDMLVPFHYFGIRDMSIDGTLISDTSLFNQLISDERVSRIIEASNHYGYSGSKIKGLIFCSNVDEAKQLSLKLNDRGYNTVALSAKNSEKERSEAMSSLESDDGLDFILTVDIFNEGIDIPSVNQVIMLRATQSSIIFIQQLGRGLRKHDDKEYVTVIDFIGNYTNNYLIPIALYGDRSYNKDTIRKLITSGSSIIPGCSTINFDYISKERIFNSINSTDLNNLSFLRKDYVELKNRLGRIPLMMDYYDHGQRDAYCFVEKYKSYYEFLLKVENTINSLTDYERKLLIFYAKEILDSTRIEETIILKLSLSNRSLSVNDVLENIKTKYGIESSNETIQSAISNLNGLFNNVNDIPIHYWIEKETIYMDSDYKNNLLSKSMFYYLSDMIDYSIARYDDRFDKEKFRNGLQLYERYSRKDVCRILNWDKNEQSTMYGYRVKHHTCPIFVTYKKSDDVIKSQNYDDYFINRRQFHWMSRSNSRKSSKEIMMIEDSVHSGLRVPLFVKKSDDEGRDFYYMGDVTPKIIEETTFHDKPIVTIIFSMNDEVSESMYRYIEEV